MKNMKRVNGGQERTKRLIIERNSPIGRLYGKAPRNTNKDELLITLESMMSREKNYGDMYVVMRNIQDTVDGRTMDVSIGYGPNIRYEKYEDGISQLTMRGGLGAEAIIDGVSSQFKMGEDLREKQKSQSHLVHQQERETGGVMKK